MSQRRCRDCPDGSRRKAPYPGPRCASHHRQARKAAKTRAHERRVEQTYGLAPGEYDRLLASQGGVCALCGRGFYTKWGSVDHCHKTGRVRGIIHSYENTMLGRGRDDPDYFRRIADYLENPPASQAGLDRRPDNWKERDGHA